MVIASEYTTIPPKKPPRVRRREEALAARKGYGFERKDENSRGSDGTAKEKEDRNLLGSECNFIVNLSLSEGKQWSDLRTIRPRSAPASSPPHAVLCSLPPPRSSPFIVFYSPPPPRKLEREYPSSPAPRYRRVASIVSHRSENPQSLPICKRVADGYHSHPASLPSPSTLSSFDILSTLHQGRHTQIFSHAGHIFFDPPLRSRRLPRFDVLSGCNPLLDEPRAPSRHSNYEFDTDAAPSCLPVSATHVLSPS